MTTRRGFLACRPRHQRTGCLLGSAGLGLIRSVLVGSFRVNRKYRGRTTTTNALVLFAAPLVAEMALVLGGFTETGHLGLH